MNTHERSKPYIGVSGVVRHEYTLSSGLVVHEPQQLFIEAYAEQAGLPSVGRQLALGVKATHKTQFQDRENKFGPEWYPVGEADFAKALRPQKPNAKTLGVAQLYLDVQHVANSEYRNYFIDRVAQRGKAWLQAVQFDMLPWHEDGDLLEVLGDIKQTHDLKTLVQCHDQAMQELGPIGVVDRLGTYAADIDYVLFDAPLGTGKRLDTAALEPFLNEAYASESLAKTGIVIAGGLNASVVREELPALVEKYPDLSWDAEGQLHPYNNANKRPLQLDIVREYLQASADILL